MRQSVNKYFAKTSKFHKIQTLSRIQTNCNIKGESIVTEAFTCIKLQKLLHYII